MGGIPLGVIRLGHKANSLVGNDLPPQGHIAPKNCQGGGMVDTKDLKSFGCIAVRVRVPLLVLAFVSRGTDA